ncbi:O-antigen ligase family protein [Hyphomicrobium sp.]|uniref:O-antigen ligase family protein n=1 Tax=Hyphomicrobium sp. TaxID=82 RepID=UPI002FE0E184
MSSASSKAKLAPLDRAFLLSVVLGPAASYSIVYLFHLVLAAKLTRSVLHLLAGKAFSIPRAVRWDVAFFCFFVGWYVLSILWAENTAYALRYCAYVIMAALTVFYTIRICDTEPRLQAAFRFLAIAFSIEILLTVLEGARLIRLPFSAFSPYQTYFGRTPSDLSQFGGTAIEYILSMPTGFFGNPNNLASFLVLILPFFLLHRRWSVKLAGALSILFVVYMAGARAAMIAYVMVLLLSLILYASYAARLLTITVVVVAGSLGAGLVEIMKESEIPRVAEVGSIGVAMRDLVVGLSEGAEDQKMTSTGARVQLIMNGLGALRDSYGLGVGAGGSQTVQEQSPDQPGKLTSMHNFWVELLVDGGIGYAFVFGAWYLSLLWRLFQVARRASSPRLLYYARAFFVGFVGFIPSAIGPSSTIYMLPMWMMVGMAIATIAVERRLAVTGYKPVRTQPLRTRAAI